MSTSKAIDGYDFMTNAKRELEWSSGTGWKTTDRWKGKEDEIKGLMTMLESQYSRARIYQEGDSPIWRAEATIESLTPGTPSSSEDVVNTYELLANQVEQHMFESSVAIAAVGGNTVMGLVRGHFDEAQRGDTSYAQALTDLKNEDGVTGLTSAQQDSVESVYLNLQKESNTFYNWQYVFRRTVSIDLQSIVQANPLGVQKIWSSSTVVGNFEGLPTDAPFILPAGEWLKTPSQAGLALNRLNQITYEYWHADTWDRNRYEVYV